MDSFFKQNLQTYVDTTTGVWRWRGTTAGPESLPPETLQVFQRAAVIRDALFGGNSQTPLIRFQLAPLEMTGDATQVVLNIDGKPLSYTAGQAAQAAEMQWTGAGGQARIEFLPPVAGSPSQLSESGPWAWFKMLDQAQVQPLSTNQFRVVFQIGARQVAYDLRTAGSVNPFQLQELRGFRCPDQL